MLNIVQEVKGNTLTLTVDLSKDNGPSKSGKTRIIASTQGNVPIDGAGNGAKFGLNVYR